MLLHMYVHIMFVRKEVAINSKEELSSMKPKVRGIMTLNGVFIVPAHRIDKLWDLESDKVVEKRTK